MARGPRLGQHCFRELSINTCKTLLHCFNFCKTIKTICNLNTIKLIYLYTLTNFSQILQFFHFKITIILWKSLGLTSVAPATGAVLRYLGASVGYLRFGASVNRGMAPLSLAPLHKAWELLLALLVVPRYV